MNGVDIEFTGFGVLAESDDRVFDGNGGWCGRAGQEVVKGDGCGLGLEEFASRGVERVCGEGEVVDGDGAIEGDGGAFDVDFGVGEFGELCEDD